MHQSRREFLKFMGGGALATFGLGSFFARPRITHAADRIQGIAPGTADELRLAAGLTYNVLVREGDVIHTGSGRRFGSNNDFIAFFPDARDANRAVLWVNHEFPCMLFEGDRVFWTPKTREQFAQSRAAVGGSRLALRRNRRGEWELDPDDRKNFRVDGATKIALSRPLAGRKFAEGTLGNCAGGVTPWGTLLTCEENHIYYYGETRWRNGGPVEFLEPRENKRMDWQKFKQNSPDDYGWVVEVDLATGRAVKQIALGRCFHECATVAPFLDYNKSGRVAVYSGDDTPGGCIYKFLSNKKNDLSEGTLYAADTNNGRWVELSPRNPALKEFGSLENILIHARDAALIAGAMPQDRPEDIELMPGQSGVVLISLTNNPKQTPPNYYGSLLKLSEAGGDPAALTFKSETFLAGGPGHGTGDTFACPDNLAFDPRGNLWLTCDVSESEIGRGAYRDSGNNGLYLIPMSGAQAGKVIQVAHAPVDAEFTGPRFSPDGRTLFLSVQHPGSGTQSRAKPTSHWPDGPRPEGFPKSAVVVISGELLERVSAVAVD